MNLVATLAKYYKNCLYEEAKISAFSNLRKDDNEIVKLDGYEKIFHNYPTPYVAQENTAALTKLMLHAEINNKRQLIYGYMFITGKLADGTEIYTPLVYADCEIKRINSKLTVNIIPDTTTLNIPALSSLSTNAFRDLITTRLAELGANVELPLTEENVKDIEQTVLDLLETDAVIEDKPEFKINRENAVILTTINKGLANTISELEEISKSENEVINNSSLVAVYRDELGEEAHDALSAVYPSNTEPELKLTAPAFKVNKSQFKAVATSGKDIITAVTGAPGTGKSNTIAAIATNFVLQGKSVLIASKSNTAVDVVYNKLHNSTMYPYAVRTGNKQHIKVLTETVDKIINGKYNIPDNNYKEVYNTYLNQLIAGITANENYYKYGEQVEKYRHELHKLTSKDYDLFSMLPAKIKEHNLRKKLTEVSELCAQNQFIRAEGEKLQEWATSVLRQVPNKNIQEVQNNVTLRRNLLILLRAIQKNNDKALKEIFKSVDFKSLLQVIPAWCVTTTDVSSSIPLEAGLFDVVIIDEASQCDIATTLPLLYRAKRAVVVGDDKQLKYLSFMLDSVNKAHMTNIPKKYTYVCNYRENSIYDFANYFSKGNIILNKQYRGNNIMMKFSNEKFYNGAVTNDNSFVPNIMYTDPIGVIHVENAKTEVKKTRNTAEARAVLEKVKEIVMQEEVEGKLVRTTIGILSPFREQVKLLESMISKVFPLETIRKHKITVGTAHSFQGEERDVMLISWAIADNSPVQLFTFVNNPNLFNVSITRAQRAVINYISATNLPDGLLREYLESAEEVINKEPELCVQTA